MDGFVFMPDMIMKVFWVVKVCRIISVFRGFLEECAASIFMETGFGSGGC
jgi:hypothetical protein